MEAGMAKHSTKAEQKRTEPFFTIPIWEFRCPARKALSGDEWLIYCELRSRYNGRNNGQIIYSSRQAGDAIHKSHSTGARALARLLELGFIKVSKDSTFGQKRLSREYELTAINLTPAKRKDRLPSGTRDFMRFTKDKIDAMDKAKIESRKKEHSNMGGVDSCTHEKTLGKVVRLRVK